MIRGIGLTFDFGGSTFESCEDLFAVDALAFIELLNAGLNVPAKLLATLQQIERLVQNGILVRILPADI